MAAAPAEAKEESHEGFHEKVYEVTVDVANPINACANKARYLMTELQDQYAGRCFGGAFINEVVRILQASDCVLVRTNDSGGGTIFVRFLAKVSAFSRRDVLFPVLFESRQSLLIGRYESRPPLGRQPGDAWKPAKVAVMLRPGAGAASSVAPGQLVPVRIDQAFYSPFQEMATAVGSLLVCDGFAPVYRLQGALGPEARVELAPMLAEVEAELAARAELARGLRPTLWYFEMLLHAYRARAGAGAAPAGAGGDQAVPAWEGGPEWAGPPALGPPLSGEPRSVVDVVRRVVLGGETVPVAGCWARPLRLHRSSPLAAFAPAAAGLGGREEDALDWPPRAAFAEFLKEILGALATTRELARAFADRDPESHQRNVWVAMRAAQQVW